MVTSSETDRNQIKKEKIPIRNGQEEAWEQGKDGKKRQEKEKGRPTTPDKAKQGQRRQVREKNE